MLYQEKYYYLCQIPLSAEGPQDVTVVERAESTRSFTDLFNRYEEARSHALNEDGLYSVIRADEVFVLLRTTTHDEAREEAFEQARPSLVTNLEHRVMQKKDKNALAILRDVHGVDTTGY